MRIEAAGSTFVIVDGKSDDRRYWNAKNQRWVTLGEIRNSKRFYAPSYFRLRIKAQLTLELLQQRRRSETP